MIEILSEIIKKSIKNYFDFVFEETKTQIDEKMKQVVEKVVELFKNTIPMIIYSSVFFTIGILIFIIGVSSYIDHIVGYSGSGFMIGGLILVFLGIYYKNKLEENIKDK